MRYDERTQAEIEALLGKSKPKMTQDDKPSFNLDASQVSAINKIKEWFGKSDSLIFVLSGRAGTGKSTIISEVIRELRLIDSEVKYLAPTGKAVSVLRGKGISHASTIHKFIYRFCGSTYKNQKTQTSSEITALCANGEYEEARAILDSIEESKRSKKRPKVFFAARKVNGLNKLKLIVVDEASMINDDEIDDITKLGIKTIFVGDNAQLPPVEGVNSIMDEPDAQINVIHRQGKQSRIVAFASEIMNDASLSFLKDWQTDDEVGIFERATFETLLDGMIKQREWQFLTVTNRAKDMINTRSRKLLGYSDHRFPVKGEILLAMGGHKETGIVNGIQGKVTETFTESEIEHDSIRYWVVEGKVQLLDGSNRIVNVVMRRNSFLSGNLYEFEEGESLWEYGYAMTVHKSQGSAWENVVYVYDDCLPCLQNLNYTAVTRASKRLIFVKK